MKNLVPKSLSRAAHMSVLKVRAKSPTILVVSGVVGLTATAVLAARATRKIDPLIEEHVKGRAEIGYISRDNKVMRREQQRAVLGLYIDSSKKFARLYGPTVVVGTVSAGSILWGHNILQGRHVATMAAYSSLQDQFFAYRGRVAKTLGEKAEKDIFNGAHGEWVEDPDHKGEYKLQPKFDEDGVPPYYLTPYFDESNIMWTNDAESHYGLLKGLQAHFNNKLQINGYVMLSEIYEALKLEKTPEVIVSGWLYKPKDPDHKGDNYIDFGFMNRTDPAGIAFEQFQEPSVRLSFNTDGVIWDKIG